ncbi:MAG: hypothetical protein ACOY4K_07745 [Pseudomonadota bacterium]
MRKTSTAIAAALLVLAAAGAGPARSDAAGAQTLPQTFATESQRNAYLSALREERAGIDDAIQYVDGVLRRADAGDLILMTVDAENPDRMGPFFTVSSDVFVQAMRAAVASGDMDPEVGGALAAQLARRSGQFKRALKLQRIELTGRRAEVDREIAQAMASPLAPGRGEVDKAETPGCRGFVGTWNTNYGPMWIGGTGTSINGSYEWNANGRPRKDTLSGSVNGNVATGSFSQPGYPDPQWASGTFTFTLSADGRSFSGTGTNAYGTTSLPWSGTCDGGVSTTTASGGPRKF